MFLYCRAVLASIAIWMMIPGYLAAQSTAGATAYATIMTDPGATIAEDMNGRGRNDFKLWEPASRQNNPGPTVSYKILSVYTISGFAYSVTLPPPAVVLKRREGFETISAEFYISEDCDHLKDKNIQTIQIGAIFKVATDTPSGHYATTVPYPVTIHYN